MSAMRGSTPDQRRASNPEASAWVGANAGSGKTHVLVDRVIRLMLEGADPASILCLTYTKAAATQMASRVHQRLGEWVGLSDRQLTETLDRMGCEDISHDTLARARRLFTLALETPGGFKIQTIHAFCERILQLFPVEAGMAPGFEVLNSQQSTQLLGNARDFVMLAAQRVEDSVLGLAFATVVRFVQPDVFDGLLAGLLAKRRDLQELLADYGSIANIALELRRLLAVGRDQSAADLSEELLAFDETLLQRVIAALTASTKATDLKTAQYLGTILAKPDEAEAIFRKIFFLADGKTPKKLTSVVTQSFLQGNSLVAQWLNEEAPKVTALIEQIDNLTRIEATVALLSLAMAIINQFENAKQARGSYDFEDLILRTRDLLNDTLSAQWVLYKLDRGIEHVLVDEAQDTSDAQWQIVRALTGEFFSGIGTHEAATRTLFVVGDRKQSIYSFQGADPAAFETSREEFRARITEVGQSFHDVDLTISYRSTEQVLKVVDVVFDEGNLARQGLDGKIACNLVHQSNRTTEQGLFELWPLIKPEGTVDREPWQAPVDREPARSPRRMLARRIAREIKSWIGKRKITALSRAVEAGDILILFRTRNILFDAMISELRKEGVPVAGADRLKLAKNMAVQDLMALMRFVMLPDDDYALACLLKSPLVPKALSEEQLFQVAYGRGTMSLWARLAASSEVDCISAREFLLGWQQLAGNTRPFEFLSAVLVKSRKAILARLGSEAGDALDALLESALSYEEAHASSLSGFAEWFVSENAEIKRNMDSGRNEVRLMTIHGAKGLESSIVIMPDTTGLPNDRKSHGLMFVGSGNGPSRIPLWRLSKLSESATLSAWKEADKQTDLEEYRRLLYVAMTRARDELYVCGCNNDSDPAETSWYAMVEDALGNQKNNKIELRDILQADGTMIRRYGPDPTRAAGPASDPQFPSVVPTWLTARPVHPDTVPKNWAPTRLPQAGKTMFSLHAVNRGRVIHRILQEIPGLPLEQGIALARRLLAKNQLSQELAHGIMKVIASPESEAFFGADSQAEVSIGAILPSGDRLTGTIDRLAMRGNEIWILDYKTDWSPPTELSPNHPHVRQVAAYALALSQAYPQKTVKAALLWTSTARLDWIPHGILERAISDIAAVTSQYAVPFVELE